MAVAMRGELAQEVILHADRGCQYTSGRLARFADRHNLARSVGRTGVCWDNAAAESFWATLTPVSQNPQNAAGILTNVASKQVVGTCRACLSSPIRTFR
jgi:transposase InsO family protein